MKHLKLFETAAAFEAARATLDLPNVSLIEATNGLNYLPYIAPAPTPAPHNYANDYFTLEAIDACTFSFNCPSGGIQYSIDNGSTWSEEYGETQVSVSVGDKVLVKGSMTLGGDSGYSSYGNKFITSDGRYNVEGNIFSLYYGDNFTGITDISDYDTNDIMYGGCFYGFFEDDTYLVSAEHLSLPATILATYCYKHMFYGCTSLTTAPELPATTLTEGCYYEMFTGCTSLTTAPELPATTLAESCYCYILRDCESLNYIKCLATDISASNCTCEWLNNVASTGTFVKDANMTSWTTGDSGIPEGWTVQDAA